MVDTLGEIHQMVLGVIFFTLSDLWVNFVEEYLSVTNLPVSKSNHEPRGVSEDLKGTVIHASSENWGLSVVVSEQKSLCDVHIHKSEKCNWE